VWGAEFLFLVCNSHTMSGNSLTSLLMLSVALAMPWASLLPQQAQGGMQPGMYNQGFQRIFMTYF